jgi:Cof subfamily protein (haloacid dehalogenase superfamily)
MFDCKLICTDIDGTLLGTDHEIHPETREAIRAAVDRGIVVALSSGRISGSLAYLQRELGIAGPIGCYSGCLVLDGPTVLASHPLTISQCRQVLSAVQEFDIQPIIFGKDRWYIDRPGKWHDKEVRVSKVSGTIDDFGRLLDRWEGTGERPYKVLCMSDDPTVAKAVENRLSSTFGSTLNILASSPKYIEVQAKGIDKGEVVHAICGHYGFSPSQVMAVGDYYNDLGMFREAGHAVAMGNAPDAVRQMADWVTDTNDEQGLAKAIRSVL